MTMPRCSSGSPSWIASLDHVGSFRRVREESRRRAASSYELRIPAARKIGPCPRRLRPRWPMRATPKTPGGSSEGDDGLARLLAKYEPVILGRCMARLRGADAAYDVAQTVMLRLVREFREGKRYPVPYRVVVHQVIGWTLNEHFGVKNPPQPLAGGMGPGRRRRRARRRSSSATTCWPRSPACPTASGRCASCATSRASTTTRSRRSSASRATPSTRRCTTRTRSCREAWPDA